MRARGMPLQPDLPPTGTRPVFPVVRNTLDVGWVRALVGFGLAFTGLVLEQLPSLLLNFLLGFRFSIQEYIQLQEFSMIAGFLLLGVGLFLVLQELGRRLLAPPLYTRFATFAVLVGALYLVAVGLVIVFLLPMIYGGPFAPAIPESVALAITVGDWVAQVAIGVGVLLALIGTVQALTTRGYPAVPLPPR